MSNLVAANGIQLWYEDFGDPSDPAVLLIMGLGGLGVAWPDDFCSALVAGGRHVIRFDNRDVGGSTKIDYAVQPYLIADMADDAIGLLDALGIAAAHLVGASLGGMIAQEAAIAHPSRVLTVTSWMSTPAAQNPMTGEFSDDLPPSWPKVGALSARMMTNPPTSRHEEIELSVELARTLAGTAAPFDEEAVRKYVELSMDRSASPAIGAGNNQVLAFAASPARSGRLDCLLAPVLVVHGTEDPVFPYDHAKFMHDKARDATMLSLVGIGHEMPAPILPKVARAILHHTSGGKNDDGGAASPG